MDATEAVALFVIVLLLPPVANVGRAVFAQPSASEFRWGGDAEGGAPFVEADPQRPDHVVGFDVEVAALIAQGLGRTPRFVQITFDSLDQSAKRGDFDIGLSGIDNSTEDVLVG
ncbi:MAG TPA: transporter substrate-binding domain-containing protein [Vicinamibacterales bacterium]|nr:transporter substrate-binding domain-containing protein [Vicinamibacterales bacterium]